MAAWFDPDSGHAIALGDVMALPKDLAREILMRAISALDEGEGPSAEDTLGDITIALGETAAAIKRDRADDGRVNDHRLHADHFARAMSIAARGHAAAVKRADAEGGK